MTSAPWHQWFAWHPVRTNYHGWKWLTTVYRRQRWTGPMWGHGQDRYWEYQLDDWSDSLEINPQAYETYWR